MFTETIRLSGWHKFSGLMGPPQSCHNNNNRESERHKDSSLLLLMISTTNSEIDKLSPDSVVSFAPLGYFVTFEVGRENFQGYFHSIPPSVVVFCGGGLKYTARAKIATQSKRWFSIYFKRVHSSNESRTNFMRIGNGMSNCSIAYLIQIFLNLLLKLFRND